MGYRAQAEISVFAEMGCDTNGQPLNWWPKPQDLKTLWGLPALCFSPVVSSLVVSPHSGPALRK
jgi:hypothetical protein